MSAHHAPLAEADLVIIGAGPGGMAAAVEMARAGGSPLVVEARSEIGGNAARSTGYIAALHSEEQRQAAVADSEDQFFADMLREVALQRDRYGLIFDEHLARELVRGSDGTYSFLVQLGARFNRFIPRPEQHTALRMLAIEDATLFRTIYERAFAQLGVQVLLQTRAVRLLVEDGQVVGAVVRTRDVNADGHERLGEPRVVRGRRGVLLAAGGYQANPALRLRYQPAYMARTPYLGVDTDRGDGHLMGQAVGGDLINMTMIPPLVMVGSALVEDCIAVNLAGRRFHDETGPYDDRVEALVNQAERRAYYIFDARVAREKAALVAEMPEPPISRDSLAVLSAAIGVDADGLNESVAIWNRHVQSGADRDPGFGRVVFPAERTGIAEPPFSAAPMVIGVNFPAGGFRVTPEMRVLNVYGRVIPGLFAVGDCLGGVNPAAGLGGMHILAATTFGRVAARAALSGAGATEHGSADLTEGAPLAGASTLRMEIVNVSSASSAAR